ncbi:hypothetical protein [Amycolatopsis sp. NPDC102389]|uniref:hypothetical protein n=1 Tax=Amycolatopsis sp. NPDC102389 TaxID=3363941 RepID=UPI003830B8BB
MDDTRNESWPVVLDDVTCALETLTAALDDSAVLLHRMCEQVTQAVPGVDEATITLITDGVATTAATTSDVAAALDRDQYLIGDGRPVRHLRHRRAAYDVSRPLGSFSARQEEAALGPGAGLGCGTVNPGCSPG